MKLFFHFVVVGFSNTYLLCNENCNDAIIIDPGILDIELLKIIEKNKFYIKSVLITHNHKAHVHGLKTLLKIYNADVYSNLPEIFNIKCKKLIDGDTILLSGLNISVIDVPGHSSDSLVYKINNNMLFTGDVLAAGIIGSTPDEYTRKLLIDSLNDKIFTLNENLLIFPGHGPPSTLKSEKLYNKYSQIHSF